MNKKAVLPPLAIGMAAAVAYALSGSLALPCPMVVLALLLAAGPIWLDLCQHALFERRAILSGSAREESTLRRFLWRGRLTAGTLGISAAMWSAVLLAMGWLLTPLHWLVVLAVAVALALAVGPLNRWLSRHVLPERVGQVGRLWPLRWLTLAVLTIGFVGIDFFVGAPDTRGFAWEVVARRAFDAAQADLSCEATRWVVGVLAALDALAWHAWQSFIPALDGRWSRLLGWLAVLLQAGLFSLALTRFVLGSLALVDRLTAESSQPRKEPLPFGVAAAVIAGLVAVVTVSARGVNHPRLPDILCKADAAEALLLHATLTRQVQSSRDTAIEQANAEIEASLDDLYAGVERGVDSYLDWYFSIIGEYQRLWFTVLRGKSEDYISAEIQKRLFEDHQFEARLAQLTARISTQTIETLGKLAGDVQAKAKEQVRLRACALKKVQLPEMDHIKEKSERAGSDALAGVLPAVIGRKAAAAGLAAVVSTKAFRAGTRLLGIVVKRTVGGAPVLACVASGPLAPVCAGFVYVIVWLGLDKALLEISEAMLRDKMKEELLASLGAHRAELATALKLRHLLEADAMARSIRRSVDGAFIPARDGI